MNDLNKNNSVEDQEELNRNMDASEESGSSDEFEVYDPDALPGMAEVPPEPPDEESVQEEPPVPPGSKPEEPMIDEIAARDESRMGRLARSGLRWALGIFIVFGIGFLVALFALYQPAVNRKRDVQSELDGANQQIADLQAEISTLEGDIDSLQGVQDQVDELQAQLDENEVEMLIMRARASVAQARLSLYTEEENQFTLYWDTTMDALSRIKSQMPSNQQNAIESLEQRMILVADEFAESPESAQSDLEIVGNRLLELQDSLFGGP